MTTSAGTKVVPVEPTEDMERAAWNAIARHSEEHGKYQQQASVIYKAMLAAAPSAPVQALQLVKRLRDGCPLIPESEAPDEDIFDYEASNKLMMEAAAEIERPSAAASSPVAADSFRERICSALGEHVDTDVERIVAGIEHLRAQCREPVGKYTDEKGRPITYWGGMAEKVDAGSAEPVALELAVQRFLGWRLPENFNPDAGISFKPDYNEGTQYPMKHQPVGTNLFTADQAREMLKYVLQEYTRPPAPKTTWIDAATAERNSRPPAPKVSDEKVREIVDRHWTACGVGQYRQTIVDAIREALELAGRQA